MKPSNTGLRNGERAMGVFALVGALACASPPLETLVEELLSSGIVAAETERGVTVYLPEVLFDFDSAELSPAGGVTLGGVAAIIERTAPRYAIAIEGHADSTGGEVYNLDLSIRRADRVAEVLRASGIGPERISVLGFGEARPSVSNQSREGRQVNRRVEIVVLRRGVAAPPPQEDAP